jgi:hypothetical protein
MNKSFLILILFSFFLLNRTEAGVIILNKSIKLNTRHYYSDTSKIIINEHGDTIFLKKRKFTAIILTLLTGPIGGHRLYLGTKPIVPIVYAVTLGGGFLVIPIMDLFTIIFTKDLNKFENNDKVLMWINGESDDFFEDD